MIAISREDWRALVAFVRDEKRTLMGSFGIPGRKRSTWAAEYKREDPEGFELFQRAKEAIARGRSAGRR